MTGQLWGQRGTGAAAQSHRLAVRGGFLTLLFASNLIASEATYQKYFFKEPRALALDTARVMFRRAPGAGAQPARALRDVGVAADRVEDARLAGWSVATLPAESRRAEKIRQALGAMSLDPDVAFVSPVFQGERGLIALTPEVLVAFKDDVGPQQAQAVLAAEKVGAILDRGWGGMQRAYRLRSPARSGLDVLETANRLARRPEVRFAEPDMIFTGRSSTIPDDPGFPLCWGLHNTGQFGGTNDADLDAPEAWDLTSGSASIIVVVLDTGVQQNHPDLHQVPGIDTTSDAGDGGPVNSCDRHGTAVAGCVSARINNSLGTAGIAPGCRVASARTFISNGACNNTWTSQVSWTVNSLAWAESIGARVTNNSNSYDFHLQSSAIAQKYLELHSAGMVHFASAGNENWQTLTYPASLPGVNAVGALNRLGNRAYFSNFGPDLDFCAPGDTIYSTDRTGSAGYYGGDYGYLWGTSFAAPYAAGVAALMLSVNPALDAQQVETILQQTCADLGSPGRDDTFGWGFVNARQAVLAAADVDADGVQVVEDNCPEAANPDQADADEDGIGDACDACTDTDDDGYGDPGHPASTCPADTCPNTISGCMVDSQGCPPAIAGDFDRDGDIDAVSDLAHFTECHGHSGPNVSQNYAECMNTDLDADGDTDQSDFAILQRCLSGHNEIADPNCG